MKGVTVGENKGFIWRQRGLVVLLIPAFTIYVSDYLDMTAFLIYTLFVLFISLVYAVNSSYVVEKYEALISYKDNMYETLHTNYTHYKDKCFELDQEYSKLKTEYEDKDRHLHQMAACYNHMMEKHTAEKFGVSHEDYMKWSFGDVDEMTPEGRAIMEAHEAGEDREKQTQ